MQPLTFQFASKPLFGIPPFVCFLLMGGVISNRKTAEALRKTLQHLESDPSVDSTDPAFVNLKCYLLQRVLELDLDTAETQASIHIVESPETEHSKVALPKKEGTLIA